MGRTVDVKEKLSKFLQAIGSEYQAQQKTKSDLVESVGGPIGRAMQKVPQTATTPLASMMVRSYGRNLERVTSPQGRKDIAEGMVKLAKERPSFKTLEIIGIF